MEKGVTLAAAEGRALSFGSINVWLQKAYVRYDGLDDILPTSIEISTFNHSEISNEELDEIIAIEHEKVSMQFKAQLGITNETE